MSILCLKHVLFLVNVFLLGYRELCSCGSPVNVYVSCEHCVRMCGTVNHMDEYVYNVMCVLRCMCVRSLVTCMIWTLFDSFVDVQED